LVPWSRREKRREKKEKREGKREGSFQKGGNGLSLSPLLETLWRLMPEGIGRKKKEESLPEPADATLSIRERVTKKREGRRKPAGRKRGYLAGSRVDFGRR